MYFIDELDGGNVYKYTPAANYADVLAGRPTTSRPGRRRSSAWATAIPPTPPAPDVGPDHDAAGAALSGAITITDPNGVQSVDARNTTNVAAFKGTDYQRPEDLQVQKIGAGRAGLHDTTTTNEVYASPRGEDRSVFANASATNLATGLAVGPTGHQPGQPRGR